MLLSQSIFVFLSFLEFLLLSIIEEAVHSNEAFYDSRVNTSNCSKSYSNIHYPSSVLSSI